MVSDGMCYQLAPAGPSLCRRLRGVPFHMVQSVLRMDKFV